MNKITSCFFRSLPITLLIVLLGYIIAYFFLNDPKKFDFTLFVLGAIPIGMFLPSVFSQSKSGAIHTPKVIFRKVETLEKKGSKKTENIFPALSYVFAGALTWLFSWVVY